MQGHFSCIDRDSSRSCLCGLVLPEQKGLENHLFLELRRMEEKRSVSKSCFEAQRRSKNCGVIRRKRKSAVGRHQTFPSPASTLLPPHRFDLAMMRYTSVVIAAFRAIDRSFGTQYANNRGKRERNVESFPRDVEGAEDSIFPFRMEKKERERRRVPFLLS